MTRSMQKQITILDIHFDLIEKTQKQDSSFKTSEFVRWALDNKLTEYLANNS